MEELETRFREIEQKSVDFRAKIDTNFQSYKTRISLFLNEFEGDKTPQQKQKRVKRLATITDDDETVDEESCDISEASDAPAMAALRPVRTARVKAAENLKEPTLNSKLRREKESTQVKPERISDERKENDANERNRTGAIPKRKSGDEGFESQGTAERASAAIVKKTSSAASMASVEIVPSEEVKIEILSDSECEKMPPPPVPAPKARGRPRTRKAAENPESKVKVERSSSSRSARTKKKVAEKPPEEEEASPVLREAQIKLERISAEQLAELVEKPTPPTKPARQLVPTASVDSELSLYEDAQSQPSPVADTTFTKTVTPNGNATFAVPTSSARHPRPDANDTFTVLSKNAVEESPLSLPVKTTASAPTLSSGKPLRKNELFNPCMPSPVKEKVQAFEKHAAAALLSPAGTRLRSRIQNAAPGDIIKGKCAATPISAYTISSKQHTPLTQAYSAPNLHLGQSSSTSKAMPVKSLLLAQSQSKKAASAVKAPPASASSSNSRDNLDDLARTQATIDEKRKRREEKQRAAREQREQIERDRREQAERAAREKDEKYQRMMAEREERKRAALDKIGNGGLKKALEDSARIATAAAAATRTQDISRMELSRLEQQNRAARDEALKLSAVKEDMQRQLKKHMHLAQLEREKNKALAAKVHEFRCLNTDDSTDDESAPSKKRPPPPAWSKGSARKNTIEMQPFVNVKVVDDFFSVKPMTPDLKEIFPAIKPDKLKRNSSAVWRTPPRHSQIPKI